MILDGDEVGRLKRGESLSLDVQPGHHELHLSIDWCRSPKVELHLIADGEVVVGCSPQRNPLIAPIVAVFCRSRYIRAAVDNAP